MREDRAHAPSQAAAMVAVLAWMLPACGGHESTVTLAPPQVAVAPAAVRDVTEFFDTTGRIAAIEAVDVRSRVAGYIVRVNFQDGANVTKGDILVEIDPRPFEAAVHQTEGELARWEALLRKARAEVARYRILTPKGAASQETLETSLAQLESAEAEIKATQAKLEQAALDLEWSRVIAPISGRVSRTALTVGNLVQVTGLSSQPLTTIVTTDPVYVYFDVDERTLQRAQQSYARSRGEPPPEHVTDLEIPVEIGLVTDSGFPHGGKLDFLDNRVDPTTGTIQARAVFRNDPAVLTAGMFCRVRLPLSQKPGAVVVSERAVGTDQDGKYVLVVNDQNVVEYRPVRLGTLSEGERVVEAGLLAGERIIVSGLQRVRPGVIVEPHQAQAGSPVTPPARNEQETGHRPPA